MNKFVKMRVLVLGLGGVGLELAKNLILAGPKSVTIFDHSKLTERDLEYNYYISEEDVQKSMQRIVATLPKLAELNNYVDVEPLSVSNFEDIFSEDILNRFDLVVVTEWYNIETVQRLNDVCHLMNKGFIFAAAAGLAGAVFVDFGKGHIINDKDGEECFTSLVSNITEEGIVNTHDNQRHNLLEGDLVKFTELVGMEALNNIPIRVEKVITPYSFSIGSIKQHNPGRYIRNGIITQLKEPKKVEYKPLRESIQNLSEQLLDCDFDWENDQRVNYMKLILHTYWVFVSEWGFPDFYDTKALQKFENLLLEKMTAAGKTEEWKQLAGLHIHKLFFSLSSGQFSPVQGFFGAIAAQEIVKFTGKYTPIEQWFVHEWYWAAFKKIPFENFLKNQEDVVQNKGNRYISHIALLGKQLHDKMQASNVFMVGAGALGCEYLKLFSMIGLSCGSGQLTVTDDDTIEVSNLNRQFLFRRQHINSSKSETACGEAQKMNRFLNVAPKKSRVSPDTEDIFTDQFWDELNFVVNAVDNIKARQYVDQKCVLHQKPLFEAGTLGTKCNSQLVLPGNTEAYGDSQDPQEKQVPMCTMRSFPFLIDHCIEWARSKFFDLFVQTSKFLKEFIENPKKGIEKFNKELKDNVATVKELCENLEGFIPLLQNPTPEAFVKFARDFYQYAFHNQIQQLLTSFPEDARDKEGNLFWTSPKRPPMIVPFDINNEHHIGFILTIVRILQQFIIPKQPIEFTPNQLKDVLLRIPVKEIKVDLSEEAKAKLINEAANNQDASHDLNTLKQVCSTLVEISNNTQGLRFEEVEFEKDCDANGHIDFITFTANSRAANYKIEPLPRHRIKIIAGKIIPAIATTTAMVASAVCVEIYKHFLQVPLDCTRNFFSNLAIPIFMFSEPSPPVIHKDKEFDQILLGPVKAIPPKFDTWSRFEIQGPLTLNQINDHFKKVHGFSLSTFTIGNQEIYSTYSTQLAPRLEMTVEQIMKEKGFPIFPGKKYVVLVVGGETEDMVDVDCPYIKYHLQA